MRQATDAMRWSRLLITTALSLFVIFGLIDAINVSKSRAIFSFSSFGGYIFEVVCVLKLRAQILAK